MRRRDFITVIGGAAAWPMAARAQRTSTPVIGFLGATMPAQSLQFTAALHQGLKEAGFIEGQNVAFEYRWAEGQYERLPALAADLVGRRVAVIVPIGGAPPTVAAKAATSTIPIVFNMGADPVRLGLVESLSRPGGNATGVAMLQIEIEVKRLELLCEFVPAAALLATLVNPGNPQSETQVRAIQQSARALGKDVLILTASTQRELEAVFPTIAERRAGALLVGGDSYLGTQFALLHALAMRHRIPASYVSRENVMQGGLMSYGTSFADRYREAGIYAGRILKGEKPGDLPVMQSTKFDFVINLKTAKALGLTVPPTLRALATEVIE
jgi:putative tryptophan/tyrosine transport system substrate-binding protein